MWRKIRWQINADQRFKSPNKFSSDKQRKRCAHEFYINHIPVRMNKVSAKKKAHIRETKPRSPLWFSNDWQDAKVDFWRSRSASSKRAETSTSKDHRTHGNHSVSSFSKALRLCSSTRVVHIESCAQNSSCLTFWRENNRKLVLRARNRNSLSDFHCESILHSQSVTLEYREYRLELWMHFVRLKPV